MDSTGLASSPQPHGLSRPRRTTSAVLALARDVVVRVFDDGVGTAAPAALPTRSTT